MLNFITDQVDLSGLSAIGRAAKDRLYRERLMFVHVPKSGGTSLSHALRVRYPFSQFRLREEESWAAAEDLPLGGWMDFKRRLVGYHAELGTHFVQGHIAVDAAFLEKYADRYHFITILRDPVDRVLSHYFFDPSLREMEPEAFLASERGFIETHVLCHFFGELGWDDRQDADAAVARAIANLERFSVVGLLENMDAFYAGLRAKTGLRLSIPKRNVGKHRDESELAPGFVEEVRRLCADDERIFRHFQHQTERLAAE